MCSECSKPAPYPNIHTHYAPSKYLQVTPLTPILEAYMTTIGYMLTLSHPYRIFPSVSLNPADWLVFVSLKIE